MRNRPTQRNGTTIGPVADITGPIAVQADGPSATSSLAWATWALFVGLALMLMGAGLFATLLGVRSELENFSTGTIGVISAAYYAGFLIGSRLALKALNKVGHIRVYTALAAILSAAILGIGLSVTPASWIVLRFITGLCLAGQYVVAEAWLNQLTGSRHRGRLLAIYGLVTTGGYAAGQLLFSTVDPKAVTGFAVGAILISLAVAPVALSEDAAPPMMEEPEHLSIREMLDIVPTGVGTSVLVGLAHGGFIALGAVYATRAGFSAGQIGRFVAAPEIGALLFHWPIAAASDDVDRRQVGAMAAFATIIACLLLLSHGPEGWTGLALMALIGGSSFPLYSIAGAYTNDWVPPEKIPAAASKLVMLYGAGALLGPILTTTVMSATNLDGFIWTMVGLHVLIMLFLIYRFFAYRVPVLKRPLSEVSLSARAFYVPVTVVALGRRYRSRREELDAELANAPEQPQQDP
jgi:MFS family permease